MEVTFKKHTGYGFYRSYQNITICQHSLTHRKVVHTMLLRAMSNAMTVFDWSISPDTLLCVVLRINTKTDEQLPYYPADVPQQTYAAEHLKK